MPSPQTLAGAKLIAVPAVLSLMDVAASLLGQPSEYWQGDLSLATDANPAVLYALQVSPWLSIPGAVFWLAMISVLMIRLAPKWRRTAYTVLSLMHMTLVWAWIIKWDLTLGLTFSIFVFIVIQLMHFQLRRDRELEES